MHPLPETHEAILKNFFKQEEDTDLPADVLEMYDTLRRCMRMMGFPVTEHQLVLIPLLLQAVPPTPAVTILDAIKDKTIGRDDLVCAKWRGEWRFGRLITADARRKTLTVVLDDGTAEERQFLPKDVRLPTDKELETYGLEPAR